MLNLKFALVTACPSNGPIDTVMHGDFWNMYYWMRLFNVNYHYCYNDLKDNYAELDKYDVVMFSGDSAYIEKISYLASKTKAITIWFPEGDISLYHEARFGGISQTIYQAMNACSVVAVVEEDKVNFWQSLLYKPVRFLHIPVPDGIIRGGFRVGEFLKTQDILIYGDNNPNNPIVPVSVAKMLKRPVAITQLTDSEINCIRNYFGVAVTRSSPKVGQFEYLRDWVAPSRIMIYPTRWIGTARQVISGAACGTPVIGNRDSHTQKRLFPMLGVYNYDLDRIMELATRLYEDVDFYKDCCSYAFRELEFYSVKNAVNRFIDAYKIGKENK